MPTTKAQSAGGQVRAKQQRTDALKRYYDNPNHCLNCQKVIEVKDIEAVAFTRLRKFCNRSCATAYNNTKSPKRLSIQNTCSSCGSAIGPRKTNMCRTCADARAADIAGLVTKGELFSKRNGYQSARSQIRKHAFVAYKRSCKPESCAICSYSTHIDVCHIQPVSSFGNSATLSEINHPDNLIGLCPNHHWEYDNGLIVLPK